MKKIVFFFMILVMFFYLSSCSKDSTSTSGASSDTYTWYSGEWGTCSNNTQTRTVSCKNSKGTVVDNANCTASTKPITSQTCPSNIDNSSNTTYTWSSGDWGNCLNGTQTRAIFCKDSKGTVVTDTNCTASTKPTTSETCPELNNYTYMVTTKTYSSDSDLTAAVRAEFGQTAEVVDWDTLKTEITGKSTEFMDNLGMTYDYAYLVLKGGQKYWSSNRHYLVARHDHKLPTTYSFAQHDSIDNSNLSLGSWYFTGKILARKPASTSSNISFSDDFSKDLSNWTLYSASNWKITNSELIGIYDVSCGSVGCSQADIVLNDKYQITGDWEASIDFIRIVDADHSDLYQAIGSFILWKDSQNKISLDIGGSGWNSWGGSQTSILVNIQLWNGSWSRVYYKDIAHSWDPSKWHIAKLKKKGNIYSMYIDDTLLYEFNDTYFNGQGKIGLHTYGTKRFDNFVLKTNSTTSNTDVKNIASESTITYDTISTATYSGYTPNARDTVDGIIKDLNYWTASSFATQGWLKFDFNTAKNISSITVYSYSCEYCKPVAYLKYKVQYLNNSNNWQDLTPSDWAYNLPNPRRYSGTSTNIYDLQFYLNTFNCSITTKSIKIVVEDSNAPSGSLYRTPITEVEIYGK